MEVALFQETPRCLFQSCDVSMVFSGRAIRLTKIARLSQLAFGKGFGNPVAP